MKRDARLSGVLHVLLHLAQHGRPATSEQMARAMDTHPVVIRRVLAGLRERGYVRSEKGHGGGWVLSCDPACVTLRDIYVALGSPELFAIGHRTESPECLVEQAVHGALSDALDAAEALLLERFAAVTLAALRDQVTLRARARRGVGDCAKRARGEHG